MGKYDGYHTALAPEPFRLAPLDSATFEDGVAIRHDLFDRFLPTEFLNCRAIYSELPWRKGFDVFERRAGFDGRSYNDFLDVVRSSVEFLGVPTVIITGAHAVKRLDPDSVAPISLNGERMLALGWNIKVIEKGDCGEWAKFLCRTGVIGDFCCGYGRTARIARDNGARFVVSDYNGSCIRYIAESMA